MNWNHPAAAAAEYGAAFRTEETFVSREAVEAVVVAGRRELPPVAGTRYVGFTDPSGGSSDSMTLAIAHRDGTGIAVLDAIREWRPPFSPEAVVAEAAALLKTYRITRVGGDRYAGEWPRERFRVHGIGYDPADRPKSDFYLAALPLINSGRVELLDDRKLVAQLVGLERRTARGGRDSIDHAPGAHDDVVNAVAGACVVAAMSSATLQVYAVSTQPATPTAAAAAARVCDRCHPLATDCPHARPPDPPPSPAWTPVSDTRPGFLRRFGR